MGKSKKIDAGQLIQLLQDQQILSERKLNSLRKQVGESPKPISARSLAKALVKKKQLSSSQAAELLEELKKKPEKPAAEAKPKPAESDLGLAAIEEDEPKVAQPVDDEDDEDEEDVEPDLSEAADDAVPVATLDDDDELEDTDDEDALADGFLSDALAEDAPAAATTVKRPTRGWRRFLQLPARGGRKKMIPNRWDSPLMLVGGGTLLLLIGIGIALFLHLFRGTGDEAFQRAYDDYRAQAYMQSVRKFEQFVDDYSSHPQVSLAKVRIALARIWDRVESRDWQAALETAESELPKVENEEAFSEARPELASLLPEIMEGFADQANGAESIAEKEELLAKANTTYEHIENTNYLPSSVRRGQQPRIEEILEKLESVKRAINRDEELVAVVAKMQDAAERLEIDRAYQLRRDLLRTYTELELDPRLRQAVQQVTQAQQQAVAGISELPVATAEERPTPIDFSVALAATRGASAQVSEDSIVATQARGAAYGLRTSDGQLLWRRPVGSASEMQPILVQDNAGSDALLVDAIHADVLRVDGATGQLEWRVPLGLGDIQWAVTNTDALLAANDENGGQMLQLSLQDGQPRGGLRFPTQVVAPPSFSVDARLIAQAALHSSIYFVDPDQWGCTYVHHLGHAAGTVTVTPLWVGESLLVAENPGPDFSRLHLLSPNSEQPGTFVEMIEPKRLEGRVRVPPVVLGRRLLVTTDRGRIYVFELEPGGTGGPLRLLASAVATVRAGSSSYPLVQGTDVWVADNQLTRYELQTARGQMIRKWLNNKDDTFLAPLRRVGDVLLHVRSRTGHAGITVAASRISTDAEDGQIIWETDIAVPAAGPPRINRQNQQIQSVSANGTLFKVDGQAIRSGIKNQQDTPLIGSPGPLATQLQVNPSLFVFLSNPPDNEVVLWNAQQDPALQVVAWPISDESLSATPAVLNAAVLLPTTTGPVHLLNPTTGESVAEPFQPSLTPGMTVNYLDPVVARSAPFAVVGTEQGQLFRLQLQSDPRPHLVATAQMLGDAEAASYRLTDPLALTDDAVFAVATGFDADRILICGTNDLQVVADIPLEGHVTFGPFELGDTDQILVGTDQMQLHVIEGDTVKWTQSIDDGPVGNPTLAGNRVLIATVNGHIRSFQSDTGEPLETVSLGLPIGIGPLSFTGNRYLVTGGDGTLHVVSIP